MSQDLKLYNSLSRKKEVFKPVNNDNVRLYACGPTVYSFTHIGNARMAVVFDVLARVLRTLYPKVTYVSNITDVDDKIMAASKETGEAISNITEKYTRIYNEDMAALGNKAPEVQPKATDHITHMIALIEKLVEQGHAYEADGHVLFNVPSFEKYGGLSGRSRDEQIAGARVEVAGFKKDPADFVLWKPSSEEETGWKSPWGYGRPGWHIECSAMAEEHLGLPFDIHGGGADLKFPHHENEIAQSCCAHGSEDDLSAFSKYWVHNGFVTVEGEKMSKSLGNVVLSHDLLKKGVKGEVIRLALLSTHYRKPFDWSEKLLEQTENTLSDFYRIINDSVTEEKDTELEEDFLKALYDDLNVPLSLSFLHKVAKKGFGYQLREMGSVLGILQDDPANWTRTVEAEGDDYALLQKREEARQNKDWATADKIRDQLLEKGLVIRDTSEGPILEKA